MKIWYFIAHKCLILVFRCHIHFWMDANPYVESTDHFGQDPRKKSILDQGLQYSTLMTWL